jgi:hypothetical protein
MKIAMNTVLGHGIYGLPEAARLTRLPSSRVREWFTGRSVEQGGKTIFNSDYDFVGGGKSNKIDLVSI